jgi:hypothetical protein
MKYAIIIEDSDHKENGVEVTGGGVGEGSVNPADVHREEWTPAMISFMKMGEYIANLPE